MKDEKNTKFSLDFNKEIFQKHFLEYFYSSNSIEIAIEQAFKITLANSLNKINSNFTNLIFSLFVVNTYKREQVTSYKDILDKGFYISCIRGNFRNNNKELITHLELKSSYISQYYTAYPLLAIKMTPKLTSCKFEITNILLSPKLFINLLSTNFCKCENLQLYLHNEVLPLVFICPLCGKLYMCSCQKLYYKNIYEYFSNNTQNLYKKSTYRDNICFICQNKVPPEVYSYCDITTFRKRYEPYVEALFYSTKNMNKREAENEIRKKVGYPLIGEHWVNETTLYKLCCIIFSNYTVYREYSPIWLNRQRFDIAIPELKLAIEYQGEQHFASIKHFGGEKGFAKTVKRDKEKLKKCKKEGWNIIYFNFYEELTEEKVLKKVLKFLTTN